MAFTEFCCRSGGSNLNAGTRTGSSTVPGTAADLTYASGTWVSSTGVFTPASGDPVADGVAVGDFASVYADGATVTTLVGRVTARTTTTITVSTTAKSGTTTDGTSDRTLKIGGAFQGPNGSSGFPMNFLTNACTNSAADLPRLNYKNDATYSITAAITPVGTQTCHQGFTTSYGDFGRAVLDGGTSGASYNLIGSTVGAYASLIDWECRNNGATGSATGVFWNSSFAVVSRCVFHDFRGSGFQTNNTYAMISECEFYNCNQSNAASIGGFYCLGAGNVLSHCVSHDNAGSNSNGFYTVGANVFVHCIADTNGKYGFQVQQSHLQGCDAYNNGSDGVLVTSYGTVVNCNLVKNTGWGIDGSAAVGGVIESCGFGSGSQANGSGTTTNTGAIQILRSVNYANDVTPWVDPANGDFRITLAAAKGAGRGTYTQTAASYTGTIGYPDIGAAQHIDSGGGGIPIARGMHGGMR